jgi:hypothetical protein
MDWRKTLIHSAAATMVEALLFILFPEISDSDWIGYLYFPAIFMSVAISGGSHSPSEAIVWFSFLVCSYCYWVIVFKGPWMANYLSWFTGPEPDKEKQRAEAKM